MTDLEQGQVALNTLLLIKGDVEQRCIGMGIEIETLKRRVKELEAALAPPKPSV